MSTHTRTAVLPVQEPPTAPLPKQPRWRRRKVTAGIPTAAVLIAVGAIIGGIAGCTSTPSSSSTTAPATAQPSTPSTTTSSEAATPTHTPPPTVTYTGVGAKVLKINKTTGPMAVTITHRGSSNFAVTNLNASGSQIDLLVNTIGTYTGTRLIDTMEGQQTAALKIEADGSWSVTLKRVSQMPTWDGTGTWTGKGDTVILIKSGSFTGLDSVKITNSGKSNFVVMAYGDTQDLLVNKIGNYSGEQLMPSGTALLEIQSDGTWSLHKV